MEVNRMLFEEEEEEKEEEDWEETP